MVLFSICEQKLQHFSAVFLIILFLGMASAAPSPDSSLDLEWKKWKTKFAKAYSPDEETHRRAVWEENKKKIEAHNADYEQGKTSFSMGLNQFSDLTSEEFRANCCGNMYRGEMAPDLLEPEDLGKNNYLTSGRDQQPE